MGRLYISITDEERAVIGLMSSYINTLVKEGEEIELDPDPEKVWAKNEQYHLWYWYSGSKFSTMAGWFRVDGRFVNLTLFKELTAITDQYDPEADKAQLICHRLDMSDPNVDELKRMLRCEFDKARIHLSERDEVTNDERSFPELSPEEKLKLRSIKTIEDLTEVKCLRTWKDDGLPCFGMSINGIELAFRWLDTDHAAALLAPNYTDSKTTLVKLLRIASLEGEDLDDDDEFEVDEPESFGEEGSYGDYYGNY